MIEFPEDMTPTQRVAKLIEWLHEGVEIPISEAASRLGIRRQSVYRLVDRVSVTSPNVAIEDGHLLYRDFSECE